MKLSLPRCAILPSLWTSCVHSLASPFTNSLVLFSRAKIQLKPARFQSATDNVPQSSPAAQPVKNTEKASCSWELSQSCQKYTKKLCKSFPIPLCLPASKHVFTHVPHYLLPPYIVHCREYIGSWHAPPAALLYHSYLPAATARCSVQRRGPCSANIFRKFCL